MEGVSERVSVCGCWCLQIVHVGRRLAMNAFLRFCAFAFLGVGHQNFWDKRFSGLLARRQEGNT